MERIVYINLDSLTDYEVSTDEDESPFGEDEPVLKGKRKNNDLGLSDSCSDSGDDESSSSSSDDSSDESDESCGESDDNSTEDISNLDNPYNPNTHQPVQQPMTTPAVQVSNEEEGVNNYSTCSQMATTSQSCMYAGHQGMSSMGSQDMADQVLMYLEGLVSPQREWWQQPTYFGGYPGSAHTAVHPTDTSLLIPPQYGIYPPAYTSSGHPHHSHADQAPEDSVHGYSTDSAGHPTHPSYIAYQ